MHTRSELAQKLGVSASRISQIASVARIKPRLNQEAFYTDDQAARILELGLKLRADRQKKAAKGIARVARETRRRES